MGAVGSVELSGANRGSFISVSLRPGSPHVDKAPAEFLGIHRVAALERLGMSIKRANEIVTLAVPNVSVPSAPSDIVVDFSLRVTFANRIDERLHVRESLGPDYVRGLARELAEILQDYGVPLPRRESCESLTIVRVQF